MLVYIVVLGYKEECTVNIQSIFLAIVADCSMRPKGKFRFPFATCARILPALEPYLFVQSFIFGALRFRKIISYSSISCVAVKPKKKVRKVLVLQED